MMVVQRRRWRRAQRSRKDFRATSIFQQSQSDERHSTVRCEIEYSYNLYVRIKSFSLYRLRVHFFPLTVIGQFDSRGIT